MEAWCQENGILFSEIKDSNHGSRSVDTVGAVAPHLDSKKAAEEIETLERAALTDLEEIRGARGFLSQIPYGRWGVATSSYLLTAKAKLSAAGVPVPNVLVGADSVKKGKPHPEAYLMASSKLGFLPEECLVFEDSETGIRSALRAGCSVVVVGGSQDYVDDRIVGSVPSFDDIDLVVHADGRMEVVFSSMKE